jgi:hypothetical protein
MRDDTTEPVEETEEERRQRLSIHTEAARAGFFAVASDILTTMQAQQVPEAESCVMTGAVEMAVQTWVQVAEQQGVPQQKSRKTLEAEVRLFYFKHLRLFRQHEANELRRQVNEGAHRSIEA